MKEETLKIIDYVFNHPRFREIKKDELGCWTATVEGKKYEYCVSGNVRVFINCLTAKEQIKWQKKVRRGYHAYVSPSDIGCIIRKQPVYIAESKMEDYE